MKVVGVNSGTTFIYTIILQMSPSRNCKCFEKQRAKFPSPSYLLQHMVDENER